MARLWRRLFLRRKCVNFLWIAYVLLWTSALFNYKSGIIFTMPDSLMRTQNGEDYQEEMKCKVDYDSLGLVKIDALREPSIEEIVQRNPQVKKGGWWKPEDCESWQKVAIVIPYRDRWQHLKKLINRLHPMLRTQMIQYRIFVIEQRGSSDFNRGKLSNVGFLEALEYDKFDCFILHDVDLIPEHNKNLYLCDQNARHLTSAIDELRYHVMYYSMAGGVVALNRHNFIKLNGYSNSYWGWGNEDDDLSARITYNGFLITRPPEHIGRYKMVRHKKRSRAEKGHERFLSWRSRWRNDGLNDPLGMNYTVVKRDNHPLYTNITADIGNTPIDLELRFKSEKKESFWWFLNFYFP